MEILHEQLAAACERRHIGIERREGLPESMALLLSHQIVGSVMASRTTNLSLADRPVCGLVVTCSGPAAATMPSPRRTAASCCHTLIVEDRLGIPDAG